MQVVHPKEGTIRVYDSMNGRYPECVNRLKNWLSSKTIDVLWTVSYAVDVIKVLCFIIK